MIIKILGMAIVFVSSTCIGICFAECLASRERELIHLADAVELMIGELSYSLAPVKDIVPLVAPRTEGLCRSMLEYMANLILEDYTPSEAWKKAVGKYSPKMSFTVEDAKALCSWDFLFTAYEAGEQTKHLDELKAKILSLAENAGDAKRKNSKMVKMLGVYGGILLCIVLF